MARVRTPAISLGASGKLAKTLTFHKWKGIKQAQEYAIPHNPRTPAQQANRQRLTIANAWWRSLHPLNIIREGWLNYQRTLRTKSSAYNVYLSAALKMQGIYTDPAIVYGFGFRFPDGLSWTLQDLKTQGPPTEPGDFRMYVGINSKNLVFKKAMPPDPPGVIYVTGLGGPGTKLLGQVFKDDIPRSGINEFTLF